MKYIVCDDFIYRRAEFSIDSFFDFLNNVSNEEILKKANNEYREVLYSLSSNLLKSLANVNMDKEKLCIALYKYISRCSSRATPYALSATVGLGEFSEQQNFNISKRFKHDNILVDVDGRWAFDVMRIMEEKLFDDLKIKVNNTLRFHEKDIVNIWVTNEDNSNIYKNNLVINRTKALDIIISAAKDETTIHKLLEKLSNEYPNVNNTVFINFLHELINSEIL
ncbi:hypothetical protein J0S15_002589, partial [Enterococcus faecalis]|nr:hypothetical protein [Enterococcus faecalis]